MARPDEPSTSDQVSDQSPHLRLYRPIAESGRGDADLGIGAVLGTDLDRQREQLERERERLERGTGQGGEQATNLEAGGAAPPATTSAAPGKTLGEGPRADTGFTQAGGPQPATTVSEAPDQTRPAAGVEMQPPRRAAELDPSTYGGGAGAEVRRETAPYVPDLNDSMLKSVGAGGAGDDFGTGPTAGDIGGANAAGFGASLGQGKDAPPLFKPPGGDQPISANEQQDARKAHGLAQGGAGPSQTAPDQTRAEGTFGSINETDGL